MEQRVKQTGSLPYHLLLQFLQHSPLDSALLRQAIAETNGEFSTPDEVLAERGLTTAALDE